MFGNKGKQESQKENNPGLLNSVQDSNILAKGTIIKGTFKSSEDLRLDGTIVGDVISEKRLVMGQSGKIEGKVFCAESAIKGRIEGELSVKGLLHLLSTAFLTGKIKAKKMIVEEGASYNGECLIGEHHFKETPAKV